MTLRLILMALLSVIVPLFLSACTLICDEGEPCEFPTFGLGIPIS